jgi:pimeloyl-ACP methyl ester carboxylesterase
MDKGMHAFAEIIGAVAVKSGFLAKQGCLNQEYKPNQQGPEKMQHEKNFRKREIRINLCMDKRIAFNGAQGYYKTEGKGKVVMLVHGFIEDGSMWDGMLAGLKKNYKVIVPDLPGFGKSVLTNDELSMEYYAEYLYAILKAEKVGKLILLGHSMGGYVALNFAEKYGPMLAGFGLVNSHCFEDTQQKKENRLKGIEFIKRNGTELFVRELYNSIFNEGFKKQHRKLIDALIENAQKYAPEAVMKANAAMMNRKDKSEVLKNAQVPVLFINGENDEAAPVAYTLKQASYPAIADFNLFEQCKHMSVFERKAETLKIIAAFCKRTFK